MLKNWIKISFVHQAIFCKFSRLPSYSNIQQTIYFHIQTQITFKNDGGFPFLCKQCEYVAVQMISRKLYNISFQIKSAFRHFWNYIKCNIQQHTRCLHRNGKNLKPHFIWNEILFLLYRVERFHFSKNLQYP